MPTYKTKRTKYEEKLQLNVPFNEDLDDQAILDIKELATIDRKMQITHASPFIKWVGGKRSIIVDLRKRLPNTYNNYYEAFIGGGALFFDLRPNKAFISDANLDLITTYLVVQNDVEKLIEALKIHQRLHCEEYYYSVRAMHNLVIPVDIAARLIYLNKTCYNGLYRVNRKGEFNTPIGKYTNPGICLEDNLRACSSALKNSTIEHEDFQKITPDAGDFCYFDPPYHPVNGTSFTSYAAGNFTEKDQQDLANFCKALHEKGVKLMLSNSNTAYIRSLYESDIFNIGIVNAPRNVNSKSSGRSRIEEVLITNY